MTIDSLKVEFEDRIATLTLDRPSKRNALDRVLWHGFFDALQEARSRSEVHAVLVTGAGGHFSAGADRDKIGVVPEAGSTALLPMIVGNTRAAELLLCAEFIDAERAVELGLARAAVAPEELMETSRKRARQIAGHPLEALQATKRLLLESRRDALHAARQRERRAFVELLEKGALAGRPRARTTSAEQDS